MKNKSIKIMVVVLLFSILFMPVSEMETNAATTQKKVTTKVKKPAQVKGLKKVKVSCKYYEEKKYCLTCQAICSAKIKFNKVKGATGYQILIYEKISLPEPDPYLMTPILYAKNTKKTTYTIQNLVPGTIYTIKVRAYKKDKKGKVVYGKAKSIKVSTVGVGKLKGSYYVCNCCAVMMPVNANRMYDHGMSAEKIHNELHAGGTFNHYKYK